MSAIRVRLFSRQGSGFGFRVTGSAASIPSLRVESLVREGEADESGLLRPGDIILKVNDHDVSTVSYDEARHVLDQAMDQQEIKLLIRAPIGFSTHLETTFDGEGVPKTFRVTERVYSISSSSAGDASLPRTSFTTPSTTINLNLDDTKSTDSVGNSVKRR
jgi:nitric-oxide synthase